MEWILIGFGVFVGWVFLSMYIGKKFMNSKGIASVGWFLLWLFTLSFFFSSSTFGTSSSSGAEGGYDDDHCNSWDNDCDNDTNYDNDYGSSRDSDDD
jgi:hypothetical protein